MKRTVSCVLLVLLSAFASAQQSEFVSPAGTKYLVYTPASYQTGNELHPLLISLHGKGEMGDDITMLTSRNPHQMPSRLIYLNRWPKDLPFIVLTPLYNPPVGELNPQWPADYIEEVVQQVTDAYRIDMNRIYVTGLSLGGTGTWTYAAAYPNKVAAIAPIAGRSDLTKACALKNIPAWVFHSDGDPTVTNQYSIDMIYAINSCRVSALYRRRLTTLFSKAHWGWSEIYNGSSNYRLYEWLLQFTKGNTTNTPPYVNAGLDRTMMLKPSTHIYGDFFDADGSVTNVQWRQVSGPAVTLSNTNSEYFKISKLVEGRLEFELAVTDNHGAVSTDRVVVNVVTSTTMPVVTNLVLMDGLTNTDKLTLYDGMAINLSQLGTRQVNVRADVSSGTGSVRFRVNSDQHTRTLNAPGPYYLKPQSSSSAEWEIKPGHYVISATAHASAGAAGPGMTTSVKIRIIDDAGIAGCSGAGKITREVWPGVTGTSVSSIPVATTPLAKTELWSFESPVDVWDNFGERIRGYICPPITGTYTFWIASNDNSELWLSTDASVANRQRIALVDGTTNVRQWTRYASQQSAPVTLTAGRKYYIEALHKEGLEGDHLAVGWQLPDGTLERPIPGVRLIPMGTGTASEPSGALVLDDIAPRSPGAFPNPVRRGADALNISAGNDNGTAIIRVSDMSGRTILEKDIACDNPGECGSIETGSLLPGVYVVTIRAGGDQTSHRVIVME